MPRKPKPPDDTVAPAWDQIRAVPLPPDLPPPVAEALQLLMRQFLYRWLWRGDPALVGKELLELCEEYARTVAEAVGPPPP